MDDFGSITIDNKNLLDDLLGLGANHTDLDDNLGDNEYFFNKRNNLGNHQPLPNKYNHQTSVPVNRFYLESPTFTKAEDDIYR